MKGWYFIMNNNFEINRDRLVKYLGTNQEVVEIPDGISFIGSHAFEGHGEIVKILGLGKLIRIEDHAFSDCVNLQEVDVNWDTIDHIGECAFNNCCSLEIEHLCIGNDNGYNDEDIEVSVATSIGRNAFCNCDKIKNITLFCESYSCSIFSFCNGLETVELKGTADRIHEYMFFNCKSLKKITLGNVRSIGFYAFYGCESLKEIDLSNVYMVERDSFYGTDLEHIIFPTPEDHKIWLTDFLNVTILRRNPLVLTFDDFNMILNYDDLRLNIGIPLYLLRFLAVFDFKSFKEVAEQKFDLVKKCIEKFPGFFEKYPDFLAYDIDYFIEYANNNEYYNLQIALLNYKYAHGGYLSNSIQRLSLD